jgi:IS30 family transposase
VNKSTISREIKRNQRGAADYDSDYAHKKAVLTRSRASGAKAFTKISKRMKDYIYEKLQQFPTIF